MTDNFPYKIRFNFTISASDVESDPDLEQVIEFLEYFPKKGGKNVPVKNYILALLKRDLKEKFSPEVNEFFENRDTANLSQTIASFLSSLSREERREVANSLDSLKSSNQNDPGAIIKVLMSAQSDSVRPSVRTPVIPDETPKDTDDVSVSADIQDDISPEVVEETAQEDLSDELSGYTNTDSLESDSRGTNEIPEGTEDDSAGHETASLEESSGTRPKSNDVSSQPWMCVNPSAALSGDGKH